MTLFIDQGGGPSTVFGDLYSISRQDGGLGDDIVAGDPTVVVVTYVETPGQGPTADRLNTLVNTDFGTPIVMTGLFGGIDPYSGLDVTGNGFTYIDSTSGFNVIRVVYDLSQCNGAGIFTFDVNGNQITTPGPVILYHELSHAFRAATGTTQPNDEIPAEQDENVMRGQLGLCMRDVNNHNGGCGSGDSCGGSSNGDCFIVSAAAGSPDAAIVLGLKQLRDRVFRATHLGAQLLDAIYCDYYCFSPRIAAELQRDAAARKETLTLAVRPLMAWYSIAEVVALAPDDANALAEAIDYVEQACSPDVDARAAAAALEAIGVGAPLSLTAPRFFRHLAERMQNAARLTFASWAIIDPLARIWASVCDDKDILEQVRAWLVSAPLESLNPPSGQALEAELAFLARGPFARADLRRQVGRRLASAWPEASAALRRHGFVETGVGG